MGSRQASGMRNRVVALKTRAAIGRKAARWCFEKGKKEKKSGSITGYNRCTRYGTMEPRSLGGIFRGVLRRMYQLVQSAGHIRDINRGRREGSGKRGHSIAFVAERAVLDEGQECAGTGGGRHEGIYVQCIYSTRVHQCSMKRNCAGLPPAFWSACEGRVGVLWVHWHAHWRRPPGSGI